MSDAPGIPPIVTDTAEWLRVSDQLANAFCSSVGEELLRTTQTIQKAFEPHQAMIRDSVTAMQHALGGEVAAALDRYRADLAATARVLTPVLEQTEAVRTQLRAFALQVPDVTVAESMTRDLQKAIARLAYVDKVRVRNALVHWQGINEQTRRNQLAVALATIKAWQEDSSRRVREVGALLEEAFDRWVLEPVVGALSRSSWPFASQAPLRLRRPLFDAPFVGWLRDLTCSISPHAPPLGLA